MAKAMDVNENTPNGAIWESLTSFKTWFYHILLTEVCAVELFSLKLWREDFYTLDSGVCVSESGIRTWVPNHGETCASLPPPQQMGTFGT